MKIFQCVTGGHPGLGVVVDEDHFVLLGEAAPDLPTDLVGLLALSDGLERAGAIVGTAGPRRPLGHAKFLPLITRPHAIWALALNFKTHIEETGLSTSKEHPQLFLRIAASLVGHGEPLLVPPASVARAYDYEGELGVVIGKGGRHIPRGQALSHVAGYTCCNEGSVREFQSHNRQFGLGKNFMNSGSLGPWLVTRDEVPDYASQVLSTRVNGVLRQKSSLTDLLFAVEDVVAYLSQAYELRAGDVILMGTPGALPPASDADDAADISKQLGPIKVPGLVHMKPGDVVEVEITGIGTLSNPVAADQPDAYRAS